MTDTDTGTPKGFKRTAGQDSTTYNDETDEGAHIGTHSSSSSTAPPPVQAVAAGSNSSAFGRESGHPLTRKRRAEVPTEDPDEGMNGEAGLIDIMSLHVGPAYIANPDGSICVVYFTPRVPSSTTCRETRSPPRMVTRPDHHELRGARLGL